MKDIEKFYLDKKSTDDEFLAQYVHLLSDVNFEYHIDKSVKTMKDKTTGKIFYFWWVTPPIQFLFHTEILEFINVLIHPFTSTNSDSIEWRYYT